MKERPKMREGVLGRPIAQLAMLFISLKAVEAKDVAGPERVTLGQKLGKLSAGEKMFALLGVLAVLCLFIATVISSVNSSMYDMAARAFVYICSVFGCVFLIAFFVCGCYLYHSDGSVTQCQKGCLLLGILLFTGSLILILLEISTTMSSGVADISNVSDKVKYAMCAFIGLCFIFFVTFIFTACRQCHFKRRFGLCHIMFIALALLIVLCLFATLGCIAGGLLKFSSVQGSGSLNPLPAVITLYFIFIIALLSLSCYMGFYGDHFTFTEIAFGTLGIVIVICFVALVVFRLMDPTEYSPTAQVTSLLILEFLLLIPFLYCAYRLCLLDPVIAFFKRSPQTDKAHAHNLIGDVTDSSGNAVETDN
ncbi:uncharacterized protein BXIN_2612 [Babesia sp. Xinjiang]|uniref:uncharacterized protein n=1 Tax=Babesia sp. Xinjiang TaxID=462227 RepID=UPI000A2635E8|nr:uncharacterized protein BXIN_2708 [Babesia sp. Xinjiang]XP_028872093.1 uncharacterized protein BXIN_2612 [Babesia sp. Xinjiang]ORM41571.1 hypothetical protein BXIN_2708 [Babesia sp. Xinjiang]ORM41637.1 hypothetical protein BXIN_2612 [Babesia sp. Xinjiang]